MRDGDVLAALIDPRGPRRHGPELERRAPELQVYFNAEDPVKARFVEDTIEAQVQDANAALTKLIAEVALKYLNLIDDGGASTVLGATSTCSG